MPKTEVEKLLEDAEKSHLWGSIELQYQDGKLVIIRRTITEKVRERDYRDAGQYRD